MVSEDQMKLTGARAKRATGSIYLLHLIRRQVTFEGRTVGLLQEKR